MNCQSRKGYVWDTFQVGISIPVPKDVKSLFMAVVGETITDLKRDQNVKQSVGLVVSFCTFFHVKPIHQDGVFGLKSCTIEAEYKISSFNIFNIQYYNW